jgi:hypothetical protein
LAEDVQANNGGEILTACPHENSADADHSGDAPTPYISTTTVHEANPVSVRRSINTIKQRPELLLLFTHVLSTGGRITSQRFVPHAARCFKTSRFSLAFTAACSRRTPTFKDDNFWPMKIEPLLPPLIMTPGKRQLVQRSVSLAPHKRHAEKREHFSVFFSLVCH